MLRICNNDRMTAPPIVGLLAPVPLAHLTDGEQVCRDEGRVAFGTRVWEAFRELETGAPVLIYASHATEVNLGPVVSWQARYAGWVSATISGGHPEGDRYRPPSTSGGEDNAGHWLGFWEVNDLVQLPTERRIPIARLRDRRGRTYARDFVPEGPILLSAVG